MVLIRYDYWNMKSHISYTRYDFNYFLKEVTNDRNFKKWFPSLDCNQTENQSVNPLLEEVKLVPVAHLVIPQPHQDDVRRVYPDLEDGNKEVSRGQRRSHDLCDLYTIDLPQCRLGGSPTFFRSFPLMWQSRLVPSKHMASRRPFPSILITWAYSGRDQRHVIGCFKRLKTTGNGSILLTAVVGALGRSPSGRFKVDRKFENITICLFKDIINNNKHQLESLKNRKH